MERFLGVFTLMHATGHLAGFVALMGWQREGGVVSTTLLAGRLTVGPLTAKAVGALWVALALAFVVASIAIWVRAPWRAEYTASTAVLSLMLSALCWPESQLGVPLNLSLLVLLLVMQHAAELRDFN